MMKQWTPVEFDEMLANKKDIKSKIIAADDECKRLNGLSYPNWSQSAYDQARDELDSLKTDSVKLRHDYLSSLYLSAGSLDEIREFGYRIRPVEFSNGESLAKIWKDYPKDCGNFRDSVFFCNPDFQLMLEKRVVGIARVQYYGTKFYSRSGNEATHLYLELAGLPFTMENL